MPKVERERSLAARVASFADLEDVRLFGVGANLKTPAVEGSLSYTLSSELSFQTVGDPLASLIVTGEYEVTVMDSPVSEDTEDGDEPEAEPIGEVAFTLAALYSIAEPDNELEPFSEEEFEAFAATTGQMALYPYAREFISDVTSRMGLPALHIGALRFELDSRDGD